MADSTIITGTPKTVIPKIREVLEYLRPGSVFFWDGDGAMTHEDQMRSLRLMGEEVIPAVARDGQRAGALFTLRGRRPHQPTHRRRLHCRSDCHHHCRLGRQPDNKGRGEWLFVPTLRRFSAGSSEPDPRCCSLASAGLNQPILCNPASDADWARQSATNRGARARCSGSQQG